MQLFIAGVTDRKRPVRSPEPTTPSGVPVRVMMAQKFVEQCNSNMGLRVWPDNYGGKIVEHQDLHYSQEKAFRMANEMLGRYFNGQPLNAWELKDDEAEGGQAPELPTAL